MYHHPTFSRLLRPETSARAKVVLGLFGVVVGLVLSELVLHFALPSLDFHFPTSRITDDRFTERAGKALDGNGVRYTFDAGGFRTSGARLPQAGGWTVLFIGDSFTQGFGVNADEAFPAVTCDRLLQQGVSAHCLNAGVTGFGTAHELRLLERLLQRKELPISAVVFQVLPNNDLKDNWEDGGFGLEGGHLVVYDPPRIPIAVRWREALFNNCFTRSSRLLTLAANAWFKGEGIDPHYDAAAFELERRLLQEVVATTRKRGVPIVIVVAATAWEVDAQASRPYDERARLDFVDTVVQELEVPWIDSRNVVHAPEHYIPNDGHFSVAANALMGEVLAEKLSPLLSD